MNILKKSIVVVLSLVFSLTSGMANAAFDGDYAVANWLQTLDGGSIDTSGAPLFVSLVSSDVGGLASNQDFTIAAVATSNVSFDWNYLTSDADGSSFDPFGFLLNGSFTQLTTDGLFTPQAGTFSQLVNAGDVFGFRARATDSAEGSAVTSVSNFNVTAVPEPETYAMMLAGLGLIGFMSRRKSKQS